MKCGLCGNESDGQPGYFWSGCPFTGCKKDAAVNSPVEKRPIVYAPDHSKEALDKALLSDDVVPDRVGTLIQIYPFLAPYFDSDDKIFEYDNAPYYMNARWLILTMAELLTQSEKTL